MLRKELLMGRAGKVGKKIPWRQKVRDVEFAVSGEKGEEGKSPPAPPCAQRDGGDSETETEAKVWDKKGFGEHFGV